MLTAQAAQAVGLPLLLDGAWVLDYQPGTFIGLHTDYPNLRRQHDLVSDASLWGIGRIGGDRFAANAIVLSSGHLLGHPDEYCDAEPQQLAVAELLPLARIRGRLGSQPIEPVAEIWFRQVVQQRDPGWSRRRCY